MAAFLGVLGLAETDHLADVISGETSTHVLDDVLHLAVGNPAVVAPLLSAEDLGALLVDNILDNRGLVVDVTISPVDGHLADRAFKARGEGLLLGGAGDGDDQQN